MTRWWWQNGTALSTATQYRCLASIANLSAATLGLSCLFLVVFPQSTSITGSTVKLINLFQIYSNPIDKSFIAEEETKFQPPTKRQLPLSITSEQNHSTTCTILGTLQHNTNKDFVLDLFVLN